MLYHVIGQPFAALMKQSLFQEHFFGKKLDCFYGQQTGKIIAKLETNELSILPVAGFSVIRY